MRLIVCLVALLALSSTASARFKGHYRRFWPFHGKRHFGFGHKKAVIIAQGSVPDPTGALPGPTGGTSDLPPADEEDVLPAPTLGTSLTPPPPEGGALPPPPPEGDALPTPPVSTDGGPITAESPPPVEPKVTGPGVDGVDSGVDGVDGVEPKVTGPGVDGVDGVEPKVTGPPLPPIQGNTDGALVDVQTDTSTAGTITEGVGEGAETTTDTSIAGATAEGVGEGTETTTDTSTAATDCESVVDVAGSSGLSTLTSALTAAQLSENLGPDFDGTVFAPTEDAFANLLIDLDTTAEDLLLNTDGRLTDILLIHVVPNVAAFSADLQDGQEIPTAADGVSLTVKIEGEKVYITAPSGVSAEVVNPDVEACDAVVHVIDKVLTIAE